MGWRAARVFLAAMNNWMLVGNHTELQTGVALGYIDAQFTVPGWKGIESHSFVGRVVVYQPTRPGTSLRYGVLAPAGGELRASPHSGHILLHICTTPGSTNEQFTNSGKSFLLEVVMLGRGGMSVLRVSPYTPDTRALYLLDRAVALGLSSTTDAAWHDAQATHTRSMDVAAQRATEARALTAYRLFVAQKNDQYCCICLRRVPRVRGRACAHVLACACCVLVPTYRCVLCLR